MGNNANWNNLRGSLFIILVFVATTSFAQNWQLVNSIEFDQNITALSVDGVQKIVLGFEDGEIKRYSTKGVFDAGFDQSIFSPCTIIEGWNNLKPFVFYRDLQSYFYFDRFLAFPKEYPISTTTDEFVELATIGTDNSLWVLETTRFTLKKIQESTGQLIFSVPLESIADMRRPTFLRAYQNYVLVADGSNGIIILDQFGNLVTHRYDLRDANYFQIYNDRLIFTHQNQMTISNIFGPSKSEVIELPINCKSGVLVDNSYVLLTEKTMYIYKKSD
ncbi:MAG: hypothetical protein KI790_21430 [Cyclobacteriaceae bacterium]|nr:hypothetical protein [Cyclobacteriaceae bacterium HetDA_MAG_MS6]